MEHTSDLVYEGALLHESSYSQRSEKYTEIEVDGIKIDFFDPKNKIVHEVKKSPKYEEAHEWQVKYYIYILESNGIEGVSGILEYPKLRQKTEVLLSSLDREQIEHFKEHIQQIVNSDECPDKINKSKCKNCSYFDFCYSAELQTD